MNPPNYTRPLLLVAAALVWNGSAGFYAATNRNNSDELGDAGIWIAAVLFLLGVVPGFWRRLSD
jgi:hypothetical protein